MQYVRTSLDGDTSPDLVDPKVLDACARRYQAVASLFRPPDGPCAAAIGVLVEPCLSPRGSCSLQGGRAAEAGRRALASLEDARDPSSLEDAYSLLFGGPDPLHQMPRVPPSATDYLTESPDRTRAVVTGLYRDLGFVDSHAGLDPREPCHISNELEFIAHCIDLATFELPDALRVAQEFSLVHLAPWGMLFAAATAARAEHPVYRFAGLVLEQMLCCESNVVQRGPVYGSERCYV